VDLASGVLNIKVVDIEEPPVFGAKLDTDYILGMAKMNGRVKILLDIVKVLNVEGMTILDKAA
jgi:purine-binding chemotaxis protein CheW